MKPVSIAPNVPVMCVEESRMPTMHEVARHAGVSLGTVSNVLNHPELVAEETRERVLRAISMLGFVRNGSARQLRVGSTQSIGLVVLDVSNPFFTELARGAEAAASERGYSVILCNSDNSPRKEENYLRVLEEQRVAGILIVPVEDPLISTRGLRQRGISLVLLDRLSQDNEVCSVSVDDVYGGKLAGRHLLERGHERIGYIHGPFTSMQYADRLTGLRQAVREAGLDPDRAIVPLPADTDNAQAGQACVEPFMALHDRPTAIFCGNDYLALGVIYALMRKEVRVPEDIALIGYDDIDLAPMFAVPLTTIRQPKYELGYAAASLLFDEISEDNAHGHQQIVFRPELVVRESTDPA
jgi:LacI family transcriptional regulator